MDLFTFLILIEQILLFVLIILTIAVGLITAHLISELSDAIELLVDNQKIRLNDVISKEVKV